MSDKEAAAEHWYAVIMAGGKGERFWPYSRGNRPKQLLSLTGNTSMLQTTVERIMPLIEPQRIIVVTSLLNQDRVSAALPDIPPQNILLETEGRNTLPAVAYAAAYVAKQDPAGVMAVLPADHAVRDGERFVKALRHGFEEAQKGQDIVTLGLEPTRPETGFGYIQVEDAGEAKTIRSSVPVKRFVEKPNRETAKRYIKSKEFFWNAGIFIWTAEVLRARLRELTPELDAFIEEIMPLIGTADELEALKRIYPTLEKISVDYAILEKSHNIRMIPLRKAGWRDLGTWNAMYEESDKDGAGNVISGSGETLAVDVKDSLVLNQSTMQVVGLGLEDMVVAVFNDAILILPRDRAQDVRQVVDLLKEKDKWELL